MGGVIDLTDGSGHEVLSSTGSGGLLGGQFLQDEPLESYLASDEEPKYVLRNKKSGVQIETADGTEAVAADNDYQTLAMVTDLRILFVAGQSGGDQSVSIDLSQIVEARVESSGFRTSTLTLETLSDERWVFPCRGDPSPVATYIEEAAQIWANAGRLLDDMEAAISEARERLDAGEYEAAAEQVDGGTETIQTAKNRIVELGPAASTQIADRAAPLQSDLVELQREIQAVSAGHAHAAAQDRWRAGEYRAAARAYESAVDGYERALGMGGSTPPDQTLESRLRGASTERELLRAGPLVDADTKRRHASALADPEEAAGEWEEAHERYRELLQLQWPTEDRSFLSDRELVRGQTAEIAEDAVTDHLEAGRQWLTSGDKLAVNDRPEQAQQVYERADHQFEQAKRLARELCPDHLESIEAGLEAAGHRLDGDVPTETVPEDPFAFDLDDSQDETDDETVDPEEPADIDDLSFHDSTAAQHPSAPNTADSHSRRSSSTPVRHDQSETSVLDRIQAQKEIDGGSGESVTPDTTVNHSESVTTTDDVSAGELDTDLVDLDRKQLADLAAGVWQAEGWMTTVFTAANDTVYDVVAIQNDPDRRQLIWTEAGGDDVDVTLFRQCETTLESSQADTAVILTAESASSASKERAETHGVTLVDAPAFLERVAETGLVPRLREMADRERDESPHV